MGIEFQTDGEIQQIFRRLREAAVDLAPAFREAGEALAETTKQRFESATAPDGSAWAPNTPVTVQRFLNRTKGNFRRDGGLSAQGSRRLAGKKPLTGESKSLRTTIRYRADGNGVEVGSPMIYAATHQFGASQGQFGRTRRGGPIPWGDVPARPFLGLAADDREIILQIFTDHLSRALPQ